MRARLKFYEISVIYHAPPQKTTTMWRWNMWPKLTYCNPCSQWFKIKVRVDGDHFLEESFCQTPCHQINCYLSSFLPVCIFRKTLYSNIFFTPDSVLKWVFNKVTACCVCLCVCLPLYLSAFIGVSALSWEGKLLKMSF